MLINFENVYFRNDDQTSATPSFSFSPAERPSKTHQVSVMILIKGCHRGSVRYFQAECLIISLRIHIKSCTILKLKRKKTKLCSVIKVITNFCFGSGLLQLVSQEIALLIWPKKWYIEVDYYEKFFFFSIIVLFVYGLGTE